MAKDDGGDDDGDEDGDNHHITRTITITITITTTIIIITTITIITIITILSLYYNQAQSRQHPKRGTASTKLVQQSSTSQPAKQLVSYASAGKSAGSIPGGVFAPFPQQDFFG